MLLSKRPIKDVRRSTTFTVISYFQSRSCWNRKGALNSIKKQTQQIHSSIGYGWSFIFPLNLISSPTLVLRLYLYLKRSSFLANKYFEFVNS